MHIFVGKTHWSINKVMFLLMDVSIPNRLFNFAWVNPLREGKLNFSSRFSITQRKQKNVINGSFFWHPVLVVKMTSPKNFSLAEFLAIQKSFLHYSYLWNCHSSLKIKHFFLLNYHNICCKSILFYNFEFFEDLHCKKELLTQKGLFEFKSHLQNNFSNSWARFKMGGKFEFLEKSHNHFGKVENTSSTLQIFILNMETTSREGKNTV